jgi:hypothetical protein
VQVAALKSSLVRASTLLEFPPPITSWASAVVLAGRPGCRNNARSGVMAGPKPLRILDRFLDNAVPADESPNDRPNNAPILLSSQERISVVADIEDIDGSLLFRGSSWERYSRDS